MKEMMIINRVLNMYVIILLERISLEKMSKIVIFGNLIKNFNAICLRRIKPHKSNAWRLSMSVFIIKVCI